MKVTESNARPAEPSMARIAHFSAFRTLKFCSLLEATTLVALLFVPVPLKHLGHLPIAVTIMGPVHGLAFLGYVWAVFDATSDGRWKAGEITRLVLAACLPFAGFLTGRYLDSVGPILAGRDAE
jgi:integral membrane protein